MKEPPPEEKSNESLSKNFESYSTLFHDLFFTLFQVGIILLLFVGILNITKEKEDVLYPIDLHHRFYADTSEDKGNCDLGKLRAGETAFCDGTYNIKDTTDADGHRTSQLAGKSMFATKVAVYAKNMGYVTSDSFSILLLWFSYLAFDCEHFCQKMLNSMHGLARKLYSAHFIIQFVIIVSVMSFINNLNINTINPFLTKLFKILRMKGSNSENIFLEIANDLIINVICILLLLFLFFIVPLTIYYIISLCKILTENLSILMNALSVFAVFLCVKALMLFVEFMISQFGTDAIRKQTEGKKDKANAIATAGIQNKEKFKSFLTSYIIYFFIPIMVALSKMFKLVVSLVPKMDPLKLNLKYKLMFIAIILLSFYYPIKKDLDKQFKFPYSLIYAAFAILAVMLILIQNKSVLMKTENI
jgi:hypothetical protein